MKLPDGLLPNRPPSCPPHLGEPNARLRSMGSAGSAQASAAGGQRGCHRGAKEDLAAPARGSGTGGGRADYPSSPFPPPISAGTLAAPGHAPRCKQSTCWLTRSSTAASGTSPVAASSTAAISAPTRT